MNLTPEQIAELRRRITSGNSIPVEYARVSAEELSALLDAAEREAKLRAFAVDVMACWPHGDVDGGDLQEIAEKHGLLRPETRNQPCDEEPNRCHCLEYGGRDEFPLTCYRKTELLTETRGDAAERSQWRPIESAPKDGRCLRMFWRDEYGEECYADDWFADDCWQNHENNYQHAMTAAPSGITCKLPNQEPPYTHWLEEPKPPEDRSDALDEMASLNQEMGLYDSPKPEGRGDE